MQSEITDEAMRELIAHVGVKYAPANLNLYSLARELEEWRDALASFEPLEDRSAATAQANLARTIESAARRLVAALSDPLADDVMYGENVSRLFAFDGVRRQGKSRKDWQDVPTDRSRFREWIAELASSAAKDAEVIERRRTETGSPAILGDSRSLRESVIGSALPELFESNFNRSRKGQICFRFVEGALRAMEIRTPQGGWYKVETIKRMIMRAEQTPRRVMVRRTSKKNITGTY